MTDSNDKAKAILAARQERRKKLQALEAKEAELDNMRQSQIKDRDTLTSNLRTTCKKLDEVRTQIQDLKKQGDKPAREGGTKVELAPGPAR